MFSRASLPVPKMAYFVVVGTPNCIQCEGTGAATVALAACLREAYTPRGSGLPGTDWSNYVATESLIPGNREQRSDRAKEDDGI